MKLRVLILFICLGIFPHSALGKAKSATWVSWYNYFRADQKFSYFREARSFRPNSGEIVLNTDIWERSTSGLDKVEIYSIALDDKKYTPVSFYVKRVTHTKNVTITEGILSGKDIGVRVHSSVTRGLPQTAIIKIDKQMILSGYMAMFLNKKFSMGKMKIAQNYIFNAVLEEGAKGIFDPKAVMAIATDNIIKVMGLTCREYLVNFDKISQRWWIANNGQLCQQHIAKYNIVVKLVPENEARKFP